jgi:hypothetical protein
MKLIRVLAAAATYVLFLFGASAQVGPYVIDADTLHLWHLDELSAPAADAVPGGLSLQGLLNNATLGNVSSPGFGTALNTFSNSGGTVNSSSYRGGLLLAQPALANDNTDNVSSSFVYAGAGGAFTYEALIKLNGTITLGGAPANNWMQILSMDDEGTTNRVFHFRLQDSPTPVLSFLPFSASGIALQNNVLQAPVPLVGLHGLQLDAWFHVAVAYNGMENTPGNMAFYWTRLDSGVSQANQIGTVSMAADLITASGDFALGNEARSAGESENFAGLLDEVRISGVARAADQLMFVPEPSSAMLAGVGLVGLMGLVRPRSSA